MDGRGPSGGLGEELDDFGLGVFAGVDVAEGSFFVDEEHGGDSVDAPLFGEGVPLVLGLGEFAELGPGHFVGLGEGVDGVVGVVAVHADDFQALGVVGFVEVFDAGDFGVAWAAPGGPEVDEDDFPFEVGGGEFGIGGGSAGDFEGFVEHVFLGLVGVGFGEDLFGGRGGHGAEGVKGLLGEVVVGEAEVGHA